jgi:hypothetical protein
MRSIHRCFLLVFLGGLSAVGAAPTPAGAVVRVTVSPALVELAAPAGAVGSQNLTVGNGGDTPLDLTVDVESYKDAVGRLSAVDWLVVEPRTLRLEPGEEREVTVAITVPQGLDAGGRYAAVRFTTDTGDAGAVGVGMAGKIGVPFLVAVGDEEDLTRTGDLDRFAPVMTPDGRVAFAALLTNTGNLHLRPTGAIEILQKDRTPFARLDFQPTTAVLPGAETLLSTQGSLPLPPGTTYVAKAVLEYGGTEPLTADVEFQPEALLTLTGAAVCENLDRGPTVHLGLRNEGGLALQPLVRIGVTGSTGNPIGATEPNGALLLWPGQELDAAIDLSARLTSGDYVLTVRVDAAPPDPTGRTALPPIEQEVRFRLGGLAGDAIPLCPS